MLIIQDAPLTTLNSVVFSYCFTVYFCVCLIHLLSKNWEINHWHKQMHIIVLISLFFKLLLQIFSLFHLHLWVSIMSSTLDLLELSMTASCWPWFGLRAKWSCRLNRALSSVWINSNTLWWTTSDWKQTNKSFLYIVWMKLQFIANRRYHDFS